MIWTAPGPSSPSPPWGDAPAPLPQRELEEQTQQFLRELSALRREGADSTVLGRLEVATALIQGRIALFQGDSARGSDILGALSGGSIHPDTGVLIRACYLLASSALYRQATEQVERYTATGMRLLERTRDPVQQAQFQRLRGGLFCLQGAYDKSRYYLLEAMDALRGQPCSTAVRLQLAAVYCDYGRVCRQRLEYADACSYYKRALSLLGDLPWPGGVWVYVHYGRAAFALEDHPRARELFQHGYDNAKVSGELWGRTAAAAYTAYYQAMEGGLRAGGGQLGRCPVLPAAAEFPSGGGHPPLCLHAHPQPAGPGAADGLPPRPSAHLLPGELRPAGGPPAFQRPQRIRGGAALPEPAQRHRHPAAVPCL